MTKEKVSYNICPTLYKDIQSTFEGNRTTVLKNNAVKLTYIMLSKLVRSKDGWAQLPQNYLKSVFSSNYHAFLRPLVDNGVLEVLCNETGAESYYHFDGLTKSGEKTEFNSYFRKKKVKSGMSKKYRFCPKYNSFINLYIYFNNKTKSINNTSSILFDIYPSYEEKALQTPLTKVSFLQKQRNDMSAQERRLTEDFTSTMNKLDIDFGALRIEAMNRVNSISILDFDVNPELNEDKNLVYFLGDNKPCIYNKKQIEDKMRNQGVSVISHKNKLYLSREIDFVTYRKQKCMSSYMSTIERLSNSAYYARRNKTNRRLDTNITNCPGFITKAIIQQNNLVERDLMNSQMAGLAHKLEEADVAGEDVVKFIDSAYNGTVYELIQDKLGLDTRKKAKIVAFEILFSKTENNSKNILEFTKFFPNIIKYVKNIKETTNYKDFSISLQNLESKIFIDNILPIAQKELSFVLTKHDSFIVRAEEVEKLDVIIERVFKELNFKGKIDK